LLSILAIALCAVIIGAETWDEIAEFGVVREAWFRQFLDLLHGIPSTTLLLDPHELALVVGAKDELTQRSLGCPGANARVRSYPVAALRSGVCGIESFTSLLASPF